MKQYRLFNSDSELWQAFKQGSEDAFALIYQNHSSQLFSYGMHIARDQDLVKDCIQSLFVYLWDSKESLGGTDSIKFYLFRCLKRKIVAELLANKRCERLEDIYENYDFEMVIPHELRIITDQVSKEENENLIRAINQLTKRQKEATYLLYYCNLSYQEAADIMSLKVTAVYNLAYNALASLKKTMVKVSLSLLLLASF